MTILRPNPEEGAREQKLPTWAQDTISTLRMHCDRRETEIDRLRELVAELEARITEGAETNTGPEDSTAWLWREVSGEELPPLGLGQGAIITFRPASGIDISAQADGNGIMLESHLHLMVIPIERTRFLIQPVSAKIKN